MTNKSCNGIIKKKHPILESLLNRNISKKINILEKDAIILGKINTLKRLHKERLFICKVNLTSLINNIEYYLLNKYFYSDNIMPIFNYFDIIKNSLINI